jgi:3D (Asp-Asp-Asp) domain-containing protein
MHGCAAFGHRGDEERHPSSRSRARVALALLLLGAVLHTACASRPPPPSVPPSGARDMVVTAHAYTSRADETDAEPALSASGQRLRPGMRALAVSPDLLAVGLDYGTRVEVEGHGTWVVLDRMGDRHRRAIDLYMGLDRDAALAFGKRRVRIRWPAD